MFYKRKIDKLDLFKMKIFTIGKTLLEELKDKPQVWRKSLQSVCLIKDYQSEYIMNSQNSIRKETTQ